MIIEFNDKEYLYEEANLLWARLYSVLAKIAEKNPCRVYTEGVFARFL